MKQIHAVVVGFFGLILASSGCTQNVSAPEKTDAQYKADVTRGLYALVEKNIDSLEVAATELQVLAPTPVGRGWDPAQDAGKIDAMRAAWANVRAPYERIEGVVAPLFGELDVSMDQRYDAFLLEEIAGAKGDADLFDDEGVTGMHAIERILWSNAIPASVTEAEKVIQKDGKNLYVEAAFPKTEAEAMRFKSKLCAKLVSDAKLLKAQWKNAAKLDIAFAFRGLQDLMNEQSEKVNKAAAGLEESRYSQRTMADLRGNLEGVVGAYQVFQPYLVSKQGGSATKNGKTFDANIAAGFSSLKSSYAEVQGDSIPKPPLSWAAEQRINQSTADLATPFGKLFSVVYAAVDEETDGAVAQQMSLAAGLLGLIAAAK
jgi:iron uptake system component EfeO